ncbi:MAG: hypothetical protein IJW45_02490 [Oscillospiraceae bacterium]|nr:hypothetical protein [Oscillospiraceae bacterium]
MGQHQKMGSDLDLRDHSFFLRMSEGRGRDGAILRLICADQIETVMADTGLEGDYYLFCFPDCMVLASKEDREDDILYFYDWAFQLVDQVQIDYPHEVPAQFLIVAETVDRLILTDSFRNVPKYYIEKSELGTGGAKVHAFQLPELVE